MPAELSAAPFAEPLAARLARRPAAGVVVFHWLGQAGFVVQAGGRRIVIDPYLSDSLAQKYRGTAMPHERLMPPPITVEALGRVDLVLCTHHHTDHMDAATLQPLAASNPPARFVVPAASRDLAVERIGADADLVAMDAGEAVEPLPGIVVRAVRAAHETLETDAEGRHRFLGYGIAADGVGLFHSGDTIPFPGQHGEVSALAADVALLPVNGRSAALAAAGIAGNLSLDEALALCDSSGIPAMVAHHYGMFAFNTADPRRIDARAAHPDSSLRLMRAKTQIEYALRLR